MKKIDLNKFEEVKPTFREANGYGYGSEKAIKEREGKVEKHKKKLKEIRSSH